MRKKAQLLCNRLALLIADSTVDSIGGVDVEHLLALIADDEPEQADEFRKMLKASMVDTGQYAKGYAEALMRALGWGGTQAEQVWDPSQAGSSSPIIVNDPPVHTDTIGTPAIDTEPVMAGDVGKAKRKK